MDSVRRYTRSRFTGWPPVGGLGFAGFVVHDGPAAVRRNHAVRAQYRGSGRQQGAFVQHLCRGVKPRGRVRMRHHAFRPSTQYTRLHLIGGHARHRRLHICGRVHALHDAVKLLAQPACGGAVCVPLRQHLNAVRPGRKHQRLQRLGVQNAVRLFSRCRYRGRSPMPRTLRALSLRFRKRHQDRRNFLVGLAGLRELGPNHQGRLGSRKGHVPNV